MIKIKQSVYKLTALVAVFGVILSPVVASAAADSKSTTINAVIGSTISMTTSGTVTINVIPTGVGSMSSASDTVTVNTNNTTGYNLKVSDADATANLVSGANTITPDPAPPAAPTADLTVNSWGFRVDNAGTFGAGPTTAETNVATSARSWAGMPVLASPYTVKTTATVATNDVTTFWYGVKATTAKPSGTYTDSVTYTATTNA